MVDKARIETSALEAQAIVAKLEPELRAAAFREVFGALMNSAPAGVARPKEMPQVAHGAKVGEAVRKGKNLREKLIAMIKAADASGDGATTRTIKAAYRQHRQKLPGNLTRDISEMIRAGYILQLGGTAQSTLYGLTSEGDQLLASITGRE